jgi:hypothetical protein
LASRDGATARIAVRRAAIDAVKTRGFRPETVVADKGYDNARVYDEIEERGCEPVIRLRGAKANQVALPLALGGRLFPRIARHTQRFKDLYRGRVAVESEFGMLKHSYGLAPLRTRGLERVALHADIVMLARLSQARPSAGRSACRIDRSWLLDLKFGQLLRGGRSSRIDGSERSS